MNAKNSIPYGRIWSLKLHVAPKMGIAIFQNSSIWREETKDIIHSRIYPAHNVFQSVSYNISALISSNVIIKNYVNCKITSYIYLLKFKISVWLHVKDCIALTKRESVRRIVFCNYRSGLSLSTHRPMTTKNTGKYDSIGHKKQKTCVRIKRVKTDSYLTYGH
jgi:hypothetical protein